jgi:hypothetical protein
VFDLPDGITACTLREHGADMVVKDLSELLERIHS